MRPLADSTIAVTGATDGLGRALALELAAAGARVLVHGRDPARGAEVLRAVRERSGRDDARWYEADLASLAAVRELAARLADENERIDVLVNNAGIGFVDPGGGERVVSVDGHELRFAVNYLAPFLLTRLLLARLEASAPARIVNVASGGQRPVDFDDVMLERDYDGVRAYCQSKLAMVMWTFDLGDELDPRRVTATCLHPGTYMPTKMVLAAGVTPEDTLESGVEATLRLVADPGLDGVTGRYHIRRVEGRAHPAAYDAAARRRLRELTERLVGLAPAPAR